MSRHFLFLQGPHGPFFSQLGCALKASGTRVTRIGFNAGDRAFWSHNSDYLAFDKPMTEWPAYFEATLVNRAVTDIVLYGDTRPWHAHAIKAARARGLPVHVFEEGYLRPYWITYERGGTNGNSALMDLPVSRMKTAMERAESEAPKPPAHWGDMRQHIVYGALYHWFVLFRNGHYKHFKSHRGHSVAQEALRYSYRWLSTPALMVQRHRATAAIKNAGYPYHLALLQLDHDSNFQQHSNFPSTEAFLKVVFEGFAKGAPAHHHLVVKAHPLETGREPLRKICRDLASAHGVSGRVHFLPGGKLAGLLDHASSAVTVNSTAGQQALWRGIPLKAFGRSVYSKPEFVSDQPLHEFFRQPRAPDPAAYRTYRRFLLDSSQVSGGFYSRKGRKQALRQLVDMMLAPDDPYTSRLAKPEMRTFTRQFRSLP